MIVPMLPLKYFKITEPIFVTNVINCVNQRIDM